MVQLVFLLETSNFPFWKYPVNFENHTGTKPEIRLCRQSKSLLVTDRQAIVEFPYEFSELIFQYAGAAASGTPETVTVLSVLMFDPIVFFIPPDKSAGELFFHLLQDTHRFFGICQFARIIPEKQVFFSTVLFCFMNTGFQRNMITMNIRWYSDLRAFVLLALKNNPPRPILCAFSFQQSLFLKFWNDFLYASDT